MLTIILGLGIPMVVFCIINRLFKKYTLTNSIVIVFSTILSMVLVLGIMVYGTERMIEKKCNKEVIKKVYELEKDGDCYMLPSKLNFEVDKKEIKFESGDEAKMTVICNKYDVSKFVQFLFFLDTAGYNPENQIIDIIVTIPES